MILICTRSGYWAFKEKIHMWIVFLRTRFSSYVLTSIVVVRINQVLTFVVVTVDVVLPI